MASCNFLHGVEDDSHSGVATKFQADLLQDAISSHQTLNWDLEGFIASNSLALLVGPSGHFKTFLAIDWSMHIASGNPWLGRQVTQRPVLFIAGEGRAGVIRRMRGWLLHHKKRAPPVYISRAPTQLMLSGEVSEIQKFLQCHNQIEPFIVLDTLARNFGPGNENSTADMSSAIATLDLVLRAGVGATVLVVHHAPWESLSGAALRSRGSSALPGAADTIVTCRYTNGKIAVRCTKQKEGDPPPELFLSHAVVELDQQDNFGNPITTCVLTEADASAVQSQPKPKRGKHQKNVVSRLKSCAADSGNSKMQLTVENLERILKEAVVSRNRRFEARNWLLKRSWFVQNRDGYVFDVTQMDGD